MLKRLLVLVFSLFACLPPVFAGSFYVAPSVMYQGISSKNIDYMGITPQFSLGYGSLVPDSRVFLAGELIANIRGATLHNHKSGTPGLQPKYTFGAAFLPGYCLDEVLLGYVRLGIVDTRFDHLNVYRVGYQGGVGLQYNLSPSWDIRGEFSIVSYSRIDDVGNPKADEYLLGLVYRFG